MKTVPDKFSYFDAPITNTTRNREYSLFEAYRNITTDIELQNLTHMVRNAPHIKSKILPYITASGLFKERKFSEIISYSSIVSIDLDDLEMDDTNQGIKTKIFADTFLNPGLIFVSPSGNGLKIFIRVTHGDPQQHNDYFNAVSMYLYSTYSVTADPACRDISRACFLCHDPNAMYSVSGCVSVPDLFTIFSPAVIPGKPPVETHGGASHGGASHGGASHGGASHDLASHGVVSDGAPYRHGIALSFPAPNSPLLSPNSCCFNPKIAVVQATRCKPLEDLDYKTHHSDKLNECAGVQLQAENALRNIGWFMKGSYWYRPGKNEREGHSGAFKYAPGSGIRFFRNFSSTAIHFDTTKSYTDCMIIALLEYNGDYKQCINALTIKYRL